MSLTIQTAITSVGTPTLDSPATIANLAKNQGSSFPAGLTVVGITIPTVITDQTQLNFQTKSNGTQFQFDTGTLQLTLQQEIHLSQALSLCARNLWQQHEQEHVWDNEQLMSHMDAKLRADPQFANILVSPSTWRPKSSFNQTQQTIQARVAAIFQRLSLAAAQKRDTRSKYQHVEHQVRTYCGQTLGHNLRQGMYGRGIDIVQLALNNRPPSNLPPLTVDGRFGLETSPFKVRIF